MKEQNTLKDGYKYNIGFDPYREDGSGTLVISTDGGFITKDSREVWDTVKPKTEYPKFKGVIIHWITAEINDNKPNMDFIKNSKYNIDTKWLEKNNE